MRHRIISLDGGMRQIVQARDALNMLQGVVAAELMPGKNAIHVWQGDELSENALRAAVSGCGVKNVRIDGK